MEKLYKVSKTKPGADCSSDHELLITKFRLNISTICVWDGRREMGVHWRLSLMCAPFATSEIIMWASLIPSTAFASELRMHFEVSKAPRD